jgi:hypothetical protein
VQDLGAAALLQYAQRIQERQDKIIFLIL